MDESLKLNVDSKAAQKDLDGFSKALDKAAASWEKMEGTLGKGASATDKALQQSIGTLQKFAAASQAASRIRLSGPNTAGIMQFAQAMQTLSRIKGIDDSKVRSLQNFSKALATIKIPAGVARLTEFSVALSKFSAPTAAQSARLVTFFNALRQYKAPGNLGNMSAMFTALGSMKVPPAAAIGRLDALFKTLASAKAIPNANVLAAGLTAVAVAAEKAGAAAAAAPRGFQTMGAAAAAQTSKISSLGAALRGLGGGGGRFNVGYQLSTLFTTAISTATIGAFARNVIDATNSLMSLQKSMFFVTGSVPQSVDGINHFNSTVMRLGLNLKEVQGSFSKFLISAREGGLGLKQATDVFDNVALSLRTVGATNEQQVQSFYALQEMLAKGKVQAKEFTRQLAQYIPGAAAFGAQALSQVRGQTVSISQFYAEMKKGSIEAGPFVVAFAGILKTQFEPLQELMRNRPDYAINRMQSALQLFYQAAGKGAFMTEFNKSMDKFTNAMVQNGKLTEHYRDLAQKLGEGFAHLADMIGNSVQFIMEHLDGLIAGLKIFLGLKLIGTMLGWVETFGTMATALINHAAKLTGATIAQTANNAVQGKAARQALETAAAVDVEAAAYRKLAISQTGGSARNIGGAMFHNPAGEAAQVGNVALNTKYAARAFQGGTVAAEAGEAATLAGAGAAAAEVGVAGEAAAGGVAALVAGLGSLVGITEVVIVVLGAAALAWSIFGNKAKGASSDVYSFSNTFRTAMGVINSDMYNNFTKPIEGAFDNLGKMLDGFMAQHKDFFDGIENFFSKVGELAAKSGNNMMENLPFGLGTIYQYGEHVVGATGNDLAAQQAAAAKKNAPGNSKAADDIANFAVSAAAQAQENMNQNDMAVREQATAMNKDVTDAGASSMAYGAMIKHEAQLAQFNANVAKNLMDIESGGTLNPVHKTKSGAPSEYQGVGQQGTQEWFALLFQHAKEYDAVHGTHLDTYVQEAHLNKDKNGTWWVNGGKDKADSSRIYAELLAMRQQIPDMNVFMTIKGMADDMVKLSQSIGHTASPGELYLAHQAGLGGAHKIISAYEANPGQSAVSVAAAAGAHPEANKGIYYNGDGSARTLGQLMSYLNKKMTGKSTLDMDFGADGTGDALRDQHAYDSAQDQYRSALGYGSQREEAQAKFEQLVEKLGFKGFVDPATGKTMDHEGEASLASTAAVGNGQSAFYNKDDAAKALAREYQLLQEKLDPLRKINQEEQAALTIEGLKLKGLTDEATWQDRIKSKADEIRGMSEAQLAADKADFLATQDKLRTMEAQADLQKKMDEATIAMQTRHNPINSAAYAEVESKEQGANFAEKLANAQASGRLALYQQGAQAAQGSKASLTALDLNDQTSDMSAQGRMTNDQRQQAETMKSTMESLTGMQGSMADVAAYSQTFMVNVNGVQKSAYQIAQEFTAAKQAFEHPPGFQAWVNGLEPLAQRMQDIKKNFAESLSQGITDSLMGKKVDWAGMFDQMRGQLIKAQVDNLMAGLFNSFKGNDQPGAPGAKKGGWLSGLFGGGGGKSDASSAGASATHAVAQATAAGVTSAAKAVSTMTVTASAVYINGGVAGAGAAGGAGGDAAAAAVVGAAQAIQGAAAGSAGAAGVSGSAAGAGIASATTAAISQATQGLSTIANATATLGQPSGSPVADLSAGTSTLNGVTTLAPLTVGMPSHADLGTISMPNAVTAAEAGPQLSMPAPITGLSPAFGASVTPTGQGGGGFGNMLGGALGGAENAMTSLAKIGILTALGGLFKHKTNTPIQPKTVNGVIGQMSTQTTHGTAVAAHANPIASILTFIADAAIQGSGVGNNIGNALAGPGTALGGMTSALDNMPGVGWFFKGLLGSGGGSGMPSDLAGLYKEGGYAGNPVDSVSMATFRSLPHYAEGTANTSGGIPSILHDDEAVIPLSRGRAVPVELSGGSGHTTINSNVHVHGAKDMDSFRASSASINRQQNLTLKRAAARNLT